MSRWGVGIFFSWRIEEEARTEWIEKIKGRMLTGV
jgi:hypothetical protein